MFHVSRMDLGKIVTLTPRIPRNIGKSECSVTPRVCFAPTVEQCVIGVVGYAHSARLTYLGAFAELANSRWCPTVYHTDETLFEPEWVSDFHITHEEWALHPITVERVGYIDCLKMVRERVIDIVEEPRYITIADQELAYNLSDDDHVILNEILNPTL